jgi:hypothetical protein
MFWPVAQARVVISDWKEDYNRRRHSAIEAKQEPGDRAAHCSLGPANAETTLCGVVCG